MQVGKPIFRMAIALICIGAVFSHSASPQIVEVHKDVSISDEDRRYDLKSSGYDRICKAYKHDCFRDTTYWIVSRHLWSNEKNAWNRVRGNSQIRVSEFQKNGVGVFVRDELPAEIKKVYSSHFYLASEWISGCRDADSVALARRFGAMNVVKGPDPSDPECAVIDSIETVDSSSLESKARSQAMGDVLRSVLPKIYTGTPGFSTRGYSVVYGMCKNEAEMLKVLDGRDSSVFVIRVLSK